MGFQSVSYTNTNFNGFLVGVLATASNSPGTSSIANLTGSTVNFTNNNSTTATIWVNVGDTGFLKPSGAVSVNSHVSNTVVVGNSANAEVFQSYVNQDNSQNGTTSFAASGNQSPDIRGPLSSVSDVTYGIPTLAAGYSITETYEITLGAGSSITFSSNTTLALGTPEPSSAALAGLGVLGMIGYSLRRRKARGA
jgi:hypothetical protein